MSFGRSWTFDRGEESRRGRSAQTLLQTFDASEIPQSTRRSPRYTSEMAEPARRYATYEELCALPANMVGQIVFGTLHAHPRPAPKHTRAATTLTEELGPPFNRSRGGPGGWLILGGPELHLGSHVVVPGLAGWRRERMPEMPVDKAYFSMAPDWVCEVLSVDSIA